MNLADLTARVEALTGGGSDAEIIALRAVNEEVHTLVSEPKVIIPPNYGRSIDATRPLLPKHTLWAVGDMEDGPFARLVVPNPDGGYLGGYIETTAATVEFAFLAAALRARSRVQGEG